MDKYLLHAIQRLLIEYGMGIQTAEKTIAAIAAEVSYVDQKYVEYVMSEEKGARIAEGR